ncbi:MAG: hypothetical protein WB676_09180 [Bryobacteraceae bacterium]
MSQRQAGAKINDAIIRAGVKALNQNVPLDIARPALAGEHIVTAIYLAMRALESGTKDRQGP